MINLVTENLPLYLSQNNLIKLMGNNTYKLTNIPILRNTNYSTYLMSLK